MGDYPPPGTWKVQARPKLVKSVPFAKPWAPYFYWPIRTLHDKGREIAFKDDTGTSHGRSGRRFLATRNGVRYHVGVDLWGEHKDLIVACDDGTVVSATRNWHHGAGKIMVEHDSCVVNYGEVENDSWEEFGLKVGSTVNAGDSIARVGKMNTDSMCHFETYTSGTTRTYQWMIGKSKPGNLLNPTAFLLQLAANGR